MFNQFTAACLLTLFTFLGSAFGQSVADSALARSALVPSNTPTVSGKRLANGQFELQISGTTGRLFRVQASYNLEKWTDVAVYTNSAGVTRFLDAAASQSPTRFYRVVTEPSDLRPQFGIRELYLVEQIDRRPGSAEAIAKIQTSVQDGKTEDQIIAEMSQGGWPPGWTRYKIWLSRQSKSG